MTQAAIRWSALLCLLLAAPGAAADGHEERRLRIFGHLTQAWGQSSEGSIVGTEEDGTSDLRNIAIQFRWTLSPRGSAVIQLSHERRGEDIFQPHDEEVEVDWAFYERRIGDHSKLRVGRLNAPIGIYNEIRDVGTLLPFFSLPLSVYAGVLNSAETVDGISLSHTFAARSSWDLTADVYFGGWDTFQQQVDPTSRFGIDNREARAEEGMGLQLWLNTPLPEVRLGAGTMTWLLDGPLSTPDRDRWDTYHVSIDASGERWVARAEARRWRFEQDFGAFFGMPTPLVGEVERDGVYLQAGVWITPSVGLFGQYERIALEDSLDLVPGLDDFHEDAAISVNYRIRPDLLAKMEYHVADTQLPLGLPGGPGIGAGPTDVEWGIVALSVSF